MLVLSWSVTDLLVVPIECGMCYIYFVFNDTWFHLSHQFQIAHAAAAGLRTQRMLVDPVLLAALLALVAMVLLPLASMVPRWQTVDLELIPPHKKKWKNVKNT